jgi:FkbM family methyltransferase
MSDCKLPSDYLFSLLSHDRLVSAVDVGANPIDGDAPYQCLLDRGICQLVAFEPQESAFEILNKQKGANQQYLPYALGDGETQTFHICQAEGMSSLLKPDPERLRAFNLFAGFGEVVRTEQVKTRKLDDVEEVEAIDYLKIDIQGSELSVFQSGREKLRDCTLIQTEVSFQPLYEKQPMFWMVDEELRSQGFQLHTFKDIKRWSLAPLIVNDDARQGLNQLLEADAVYVRGLMNEISLSSHQLKSLCLVLHHCYGSYDLAFICIRELARRRDLPSGVETEYLQLIPYRASCRFS